MTRLRQSIGRAICVGLTFAAIPFCQVLGDDWPTFRGPNRTAVANDSKLLKSWPEAGPKLLWQGDGAGKGYSSLAIAGGKIFTLGDSLSTQKDGDEYLSCFDNVTGKQLWATKTGAALNDRRSADWGSSRSTPSVDQDRVYVVSPDGLLVCCNVADGKVVWKKHIESDLGGKKDDSWGYSESVLVDGNNVICTPGSKEATIVALDKKSGEKVWACSNPAQDRGAGHASIVISKVGNTKVYVQSTGSGLLGVSEKGKLLWTYPVGKTIAIIPTPIVRDDLVFFVAGYNRGGALVKQIPGENGDVAVKEVYGLNNKLSNKHGGVVLVGDYIYGDSEDKGIPFCANLLTGEEKWKTRGTGQGSAVVIAGGDRLYVRFQNGVMVLAEASPDAYKEISSFKIPGSGSRPGWSHPVILDGKLYLREQDKILCYDIRG
jgi:outer membrane protein assembly factor BamB